MQADVKPPESCRQIGGSSRHNRKSRYPQGGTFYPQPFLAIPNHTPIGGWLDMNAGERMRPDFR